MTSSGTGTAGTSPRLAARDITVRFGGVVALDRVSIEVWPQSIVGLVGPNGAGKSTLFSVLSGLRRPDSGRVEMDGADITSLSAGARAVRGWARTFQHPELFFDLTVREHVVLAYRAHAHHRRLWSDAFSGRGFRRPDAAETDRVETLIAALGLHDIADCGVAGLPLGQMRLVELARSLATSPSVLLLDEPSSGLDSTETAHVVSLLQQVVEQQGVSLLLVEHDVDLVLGISDQVHVLDFGSAIASGPPETIRTDPRVKAAYLGDDIEGWPA